MVVFFILILVLVGLRLTVVGFTTVKGGSMAPAVAPGATCVVWATGPATLLGVTLWQRELAVGDLVVAAHPQRKGRVLKRVVALGGQPVPKGKWLRHFRLSKTGRGVAAAKPGINCSKKGCSVAPGFAFLGSEKSEGTSDSRHFGAVQLDRLVGRVGPCF
jgi:signal peptidase I